ncbi:MAG: hypothetical protein J0653_08040 [Deltaproteobacteria bacterium]|nr:hypothetical protein [Deltaproteobacteria bacterium]
MELYDNIDAIEKHLLRYQIKEAGAMLANTTGHLAGLLAGWPAEGIQDLQNVLSAIMTGMENSDYLLVADLLHFELKPLLRRSLA